jgi:hypothetical protein
MKKIKVIFINARKREIELVEIENRLEPLQNLVQGYIECAFRLPNGDELFVNEEGLLKDFAFGFKIAGGHQPFLGNGVVVGFNEADGDSLSAKTTPKTLPTVEFFAVATKEANV